MKLLNYPKYTAPTRRGEWFVFSKNDGLQNQNVFYIQKGLDGTPELLLDPNLQAPSRIATSPCRPEVRQSTRQSLIRPLTLKNRAMTLQA